MRLVELVTQFVFGYFLWNTRNGFLVSSTLQLSRNCTNRTWVVCPKISSNLRETAKTIFTSSSRSKEVIIFFIGWLTVGGWASREVVTRTQLDPQITLNEFISLYRSVTLCNRYVTYFFDSAVSKLVLAESNLTVLAELKTCLECLQFGDIRCSQFATKISDDTDSLNF